MKRLTPKKIVIVALAPYMCFLGAILSGNHEEDSFMKSKENLAWNSPIKIAYDFSEDSSPYYEIPENDPSIDVIADAETNNIHPQAKQEENNSKVAQIASFIKSLVFSP